jgi:exonuclease VII small subunit
MKSKSIPADIKNKSIKEAQDEIKEIIKDLENPESNLEKSIVKYNRMMHLNYHIQEEFKKQLKKIKDINLLNPKPKHKKFE